MKVSIVIPMYNSEKTIGKSITSIMNQTYSDWELLLIDDGSKDSTIDVCKRMKGNDSRIKIVRCDHGGVSRARNRGIAEASYPIIAFNDADDEWHIDKLEKQIEKMNEDDFGMVYCRYAYISKTIKKYVPPVYRDIFTLEGEIFNYLWMENSVGTPTILVKHDVIDTVGGFCDAIESFEDWEFVLRVAQRYKIGFVEESLVDTDYLKEGGVNSRTKEQILALMYMINLYPNMKKDSQYERIIKRLLTLDYETQLFFRREFENWSGWKEKKDEIEKEERILTKRIDDILNGVFWKKCVDLYNINKNTRIAIYGANSIGLELYKYAKQKGICIECFYDSNVFEINGICVKIPFYDIENIEVVINATRCDLIDIDGNMSKVNTINFYEL